MSVIRDREVVKTDNVLGGEGHILRDMLLTGDQYHGKLFYMSSITLEPGCSIGVHTHETESEAYYFYEGTGIYTDGDTAVTVRPGDVTFCGVGETHGIENNSEADLKFVVVMQTAE